MSNNTFAASMNRCFLAVGSQRAQKGGESDQVAHKNLARLAFHRLMGVVYEESRT